MAGIYLHIPFCRHKCSYCNFYSVASTKYLEEFADAINKETQLRTDYINESVQTIYFGGGTPSLLSANDIQKILTGLKNNFSVEWDAEITLEANPDDLDESYLNQLKFAGINRMSIGVQSYKHKDLNYLERTHHPAHVPKAIELMKEAGFENISADLMYGIPEQTEDVLENNLLELLKYNIPHISCYALTVEPGTTLERQIQKKRKAPVEEELAAIQFQKVSDFLKRYNYEQYEVSNFAINNQYSRHNTNYWFGVPYLGLGPSAHSYNGDSRSWNVASVKKYLGNMQKDTLPSEQETLTKKQKFNEYVMLRLRTKWGIHLNEVRKLFGDSYVAHIDSKMKHMDKGGLFSFSSNNIKLTSRGFLLSDGIAAEFFMM